MTHPLVIEARKYIGHPYVYCGRGELLFNLETFKLEPSIWAPLDVFDCSGLVTVALFRAGGKDLRGSHNALRLELNCKKVSHGERRTGDLLFRSQHVAIYIAPGPDAAHVVVLEAAGGDRTTKSPAAAAVRGAYVKDHVVPESYFTSAGRMPPEWLPLPSTAS